MANELSSTPVHICRINCPFFNGCVPHLYGCLGGRPKWYSVLAYVFYILCKLSNNMRSLLFLVAVILVIGWLLGVFVYTAKGLIHILLVLAVISLLLGIIRRA